jgi:hypothetical protein
MIVNTFRLFHLNCVLWYLWMVVVFATSDLNDLYRRVNIRNNRLKRLIEIKVLK